MKINIQRTSLVAPFLIFVTVVSACAPKATPTPVDQVQIMAQAMAQIMLTQTVGAVTPTPLPPTETLTPSVTDTPVFTPTSSGPIKKPVITEFTGCWYGPGPEYKLDSNIDAGRKVEIVGMGSVPGWYVIRNPYFHKLCWVESAHVRVDPAMDLSQLPVMTPAP